MNANTKRVLKMILPAVLAGGGAAAGGYAYGKTKKSKNVSLKTKLEKQKVARYFYSLGQKNMYEKLSGFLRNK